MSEKGEMRSAINELDHVLPEVTFPSVETLRDPTLEGFIYVLGNLMRTRRYGAQESRTGTMSNHLIGVALCDGEIFSNLHFTQALYDALNGDLNAPIRDVCREAAIVAEQLLNQEPVRQNQTIFGDQMTELLAEVSSIYQDERRLQETIAALAQQTQTYAETYGADAKKSKGKGKA
jgi:CRISPR-associated protein Csc2